MNDSHDKTPQPVQLDTAKAHMPGMRTITFQVLVPDTIQLPMSQLDGGRACPSTGLMLQRYIGHADLTAQGVHVVWLDQDGQPMLTETALALMDAEQAHAAQTPTPGERIN